MMCCKNPVGITVVSLLLRPLSPFCSSPEQPVSSAHCVLSRLSLYIYSCYIYICIYIYIFTNNTVLLHKCRVFKYLSHSSRASME